MHHLNGNLNGNLNGQLNGHLNGKLNGKSTEISTDVLTFSGERVLYDLLDHIPLPLLPLLGDVHIGVLHLSQECLNK